jgi:hypothetical protein
VIFNKPEKRTRKTLAEKNVKELTRTLDRDFSEFIRLRDADDNGYCQCFTCGKWYQWRNIQNGHFISREIKAVRFNEINCHAQCESCNDYKHGRHFEYEKALVEKYGEEEVKNLRRVADMGGKHDAWQLQEMIIEYRRKVKELKREKGL